VTRGCLEAVLIQRVLDEPGFWCSDALIDGERLAQVPGGLGTVAGKLGRPGAECLELAAWPPGTPPETIGGAGMLLDRPHVRLAVRWPAP
jgi:hypothetical protein